MHQIPLVTAVNRILKPFNGQVVSDLLAASNNKIVTDIQTQIAETVEEIQLNNTWNFNYSELTLQPTVDGWMIIPPDWLYIRFLEWTDGNVWNLTVKGDHVWNSKDGTDIVSGSVKVIGTRLYSYDDLPAAVQKYVISRAKLELFGNATHLSPSRIQIAQTEEAESWRTACKWDSEQKANLAHLGVGLRQGFNGGRNIPGSAWLGNF